MLAVSGSFSLDTSIFGRFKFPSLLTSSPSFSALGLVASNSNDGDNDDNTNGNANSKLLSSVISFYH